ncbi:MAG: pentapeptide repeat-containing protein [Nitrospirota bacterium]|nr:pentapeptide repeat-containing protein [Nitrospirota bacterium]
MIAWLTLSILWGMGLTPGMLRAECTAERGETGATAAFTLRLSSTCTAVEREARAIPARDLLRALAEGRGIDLAGVVIQGDLLLDELPTQKAEAVQDLSPEDRRVLDGLHEEEVHVIRGPFVVKHARVRGRIVNRLTRGFLLITGPVVLAHTHFEGSVDLSRTVFLGLVDGSSATFGQETYFVQDHFTQGAMFSGTRFGPHTRFHRSLFAGPAIFQSAVFHGLTEFLEVVFEQNANFSRASFEMGTGFSGAHCRAACDFSAAQFDREAFFLFALFDHSVTFASARFGSQADFSDASFKERDDLAQATFVHPPFFARTTRVTATMPGRAGATPSSQAVTIALFVMALGLLLYIIKAR